MKKYNFEDYKWVEIYFIQKDLIGKSHLKILYEPYLF